MGCVRSTHAVNDSGSLVNTLELDHEPQRRLTQNVIVDNHDRNIRDFYDFEHKMVLGSGISGSVRICVHKETNIEYALKSLSKRNLKADKLMRLKEEITAMAMLDHPNILRLVEYFETDDVIYLVLDLCRGGELLDRLHEQQGHHYSEKVACKYINTILGAISYCHAHNIVHRDLKLENFLFENDSPNSELKLIDFGLSHYTKPAEVLHRAVGTPYYVAPEVLLGNYNAKCDIWSIGVIAYMLLSGCPPFYGKSDQETLASVKLGKWEFDDFLFRPISSAAKDFITKCLNMKVNSRPSAVQLLKHRWFRILKEKEDPKNAQPSLDVVNRLNHYVKRSNLSKIIMDVVSHTLQPEQITELRKEFLKFDHSKTGEITIEDLKATLQKFPAFKDTDLREVFEKMDIDQTGLISYHEFIAATISRQAITEQNMKIAFERMSNHNEEITSDDVQGLLGNSSYNLDELYNEVGLTRSSRISFSEFKTIMLGGSAIPAADSPYHMQRKKLVFWKEGEQTPRLGGNSSPPVGGSSAGASPVVSPSPSSYAALGSRSDSQSMVAQGRAVIVAPGMDPFDSLPGSATSSAKGMNYKQLSLSNPADEGKMGDSTNAMLTASNIAVEGVGSSSTGGQPSRPSGENDKNSNTLTTAESIAAVEEEGKFKSGSAHWDVES